MSARRVESQEAYVAGGKGNQRIPCLTALRACQLRDWIRRWIYRSISDTLIQEVSNHFFVEVDGITRVNVKSSLRRDEINAAAK